MWLNIFNLVNISRENKSVLSVIGWCCVKMFSVNDPSAEHKVVEHDCVLKNWPSLAAPGVSIFGKPRELEEGEARF